MVFSRIGLGKVFADSFDQAAAACVRTFPHIARGRTSLLVADFGGSHAGQLFDTYSFLVLDIDRNSEWKFGQRGFRQQVLRNARRMAFKALSDNQRRAALVPFLRLADSIDGWLVTFAISKTGGSLFAPDDPNDPLDDLKLWKPHVQERLMRVIHLSVFLLSGLSVEGQNILWLIDQDAIAANTPQLTQLTNLVGRVASETMGHNWGHLRCGTTQSDDGTLWLEDLASVCDLSCGSVCEILTAMRGTHVSLQAHVALPIPKGLSWKTRMITTWLAQERRALKKITCLLDLSTTSSKMKFSTIKWHAVPGLLLLPDEA